MTRLKTYRTPTRRRADRAVTVLLVVALVAAVAWLLAPEARAASDDPTPYTVDRHGITLPAGDTFPAHGHVNIRWTSPDGSAGIHFDPNNGHPGGQWIRKSFIPWSAFGVPKTACLTWVQISHYNEHFGEGGQSPVCLGKRPKPDPTPSPDPEPSPTPTPTPDPDPTPEPTPSPEPTPTPDPDPSPDPTPEPEPTPDPTPTPEPEPTPTPAPPPECPGIPDECDDGDQWPEPTPEPTPAPPPVDDPEPTPEPTPSPDEPDRPDLPELPETGINVGALGVIAAVLIAVGGLFYTIHRRNQ